MKPTTLCRMAACRSLNDGYLFSCAYGTGVLRSVSVVFYKQPVFLMASGRVNVVLNVTPLKPLREGVHRRHQHELRWKGDGACGSCNGDATVLQGLAQDLQRRAAELGQLIEEQHPVMGQADLTGARVGATTQQARITDGEVRRAEGTGGDEGTVLAQKSAGAVNLGRRFLLSHARHDGRDAFGQHGLARAGRANHEEVVPARRRDLHGAFGPPAGPFTSLKSMP